MNTTTLSKSIPSIEWKMMLIQCIEWCVSSIGLGSAVLLNLAVHLGKEIGSLGKQLWLWRKGKISTNELTEWLDAKAQQIFKVERLNDSKGEITRNRKKRSSLKKLKKGVKLMAFPLVIIVFTLNELFLRLKILHQKIITKDSS